MAQDYLGSLFSVAGKTALVTGGATGIGRMIAEALVRAGAHVLIASRKGEACEAVARELNALDAGGMAEGFAGDVATEAGVKALASDVRARTPHLHILVNNAGKTWGEPLESFPHKAWDGVFSVNVAGLFTLTQQLLPLLEAAASDDDPARIVNLGSVMGAAPIGDNAYSYAASKAAVHHLTRILAMEFASRRITVNAFAPGPFQSRMTAFATGDEHKRAQVAASVPLGRIGRPDDIAGALLFLCGRGGAYTTGAVIPLDGGIGVEARHKIFGEAAE
jgi:NAD(P)-dependent dehydrogenase (short-subunit alcohol dehydrogenase family)